MDPTIVYYTRSLGPERTRSISLRPVGVPAGTAWTASVFGSFQVPADTPELAALQQAGGIATGPDGDRLYEALRAACQAHLETTRAA